MPHQPPVDERGLGRARVVDDEMDVQPRPDRGIDRVEEGPKLACAMPLMELPDDLAARGPRRTSSSRGACSRRSDARLAPAASAALAASDPALELAISRQRTARGPCPAGPGRGPRCRAPYR